MRRAAKVDTNQAEIVQALRLAGCTVQPLHGVGQGCPDLLVGRDGVNTLIEVKRDAKANLTPDQVDWHRDWRGAVSVCSTSEQALAAAGVVVRVPLRGILR